MSEKFQRVEPTPFDAQQAGAAKPATQAPRHSVDRSRWLFPALALLLLLAVGVVFLLPSVVEDRVALPAPERIATTGDAASDRPAETGTANSASRAADAPSPFADAVEAKARSEAQDLLAELLDVQENLRERGAESWAPAEMAAVGEEALAGDERYRERDFATAIGHYGKALEQAIALEGTLGERFTMQVVETEAAIEALDSETALRSVELARLLEPENDDLIDLDARVASIPAIDAAMQAAFAAEAAKELENAVTELEAAAALDGAHQRVAAELARLRVALTEQRFNAAMSEGYAALDTGAFDRALGRFERAARLKPGSAEAGAALQELSVARTASQLQGLQRRGEALLAEEDWEKAIDAFEEALAIDGGLRFAREGLEVAKPRAVLDGEMQSILDEPGRLVDDAILREAKDTLTRAQALDNIGPRFLEKMTAVAQTIAVASQPIRVALASDGITEVTVYKVARLGPFEVRELELRPGQYTAVGRRRGYRDVRVVFNVSPSSNEPVYIACSETI